MANVEPPPTIARIVEVQDPGGGYYVVYVRIPPHLASRFPDKPWGTKIEDIGLAPKDIVKFAGYEWVDVDNISDRRLGDTADLFWIFQKLPGPAWTTKSQGQESLIPAKYRRLVVTTKTKQEVAPDTEPSAITGDLVQSVVEQQDNTGKALKVDTAETIDSNAEPLLGSLTDTWGVNTTEESLVPELVETSPGVFGRTPVDSGFGIKSGRVTPLGDGKAINETEYYPPDTGNDGVIYTLNEEKTDDKTGIIIDIEKSLIDASRYKALSADKRSNGWFPEVQPLDKWHSIMVSSKVDMNSLPAAETWEEGGGFSLPNELIEVGVIWDAKKNKDIGATGVNDDNFIESENIKWQVSAEITINGGISGSPYTKIKAGRRGTGSVTVVRTYHNGPPTDPVPSHSFREVYGMLMIHGVSEVHMAQGSQSGMGAKRTLNSVNYRRNTDTILTAHDFGPVVHSGALAIQHLGDSRFVTESGSASTGTLPGSGFYPVAYGSINLTGVATLLLPASGPVLGSGDSYVLDVKVSEWGFGVWVKEVYTITIP